MFAILLNEKGGEQKRIEFEKPEVTIGRVQGNDIILPKGNVSKRHSRIVVKDGKFIIVDLKSTNGTYVNGRKITSPLVVRNTDKIYIGDFIISIDEGIGVSPEEGGGRRIPTIPPPPPAAEQGEEDADDDVVEDRALDQEAVEADPAPARLVRPILPPPAPPAPATMSAVPSPAIGFSRLAEPPAAHPAPAASVAAAPRPAPAPLPPRPVVAPAIPVRRPHLSSTQGPAAAPPRKSPTLPRSEGNRSVEALRALTERLAVALHLSAEQYVVDENLSARAESAAVALLSELSSEGLLPSGPSEIDSTAIARDAVAEVLGVGPLEELIADESVQRVSVTGPNRIYVSREGGWQLHRKIFSSAEAMQRAAERLLYRAGQRAPQPSDTGHAGTREGMLPNGFHVTAAARSIADRGGALSLRRIAREHESLSELVRRGALSEQMAKLLEAAVRGRHNLVISGSTGTRRNALLSSLLPLFEGSELVLVEQGQPIDIRDGAAGPVITLRGGGCEARRALAAAARFGADYLVVGDVQGGEALDLLGAMVGGSTGTVCSVAASSPREALSRLCALSRLAADAPTARALAEEWACSIKCVVQVAHGGGQLEVCELAEVMSAEEGGFTIHTLFSGRAGHFERRGEIPEWAEGDELSS